MGCVAADVAPCAYAILILLFFLSLPFNHNSWERQNETKARVPCWVLGHARQLALAALLVADIIRGDQQEGRSGITLIGVA